MNKYGVGVAVAGIIVLTLIFGFSKQGSRTEAPSWNTYIDSKNAWEIKYPSNISTINSHESYKASKEILNDISFSSTGDAGDKVYSTYVSVTVSKTNYASIDDLLNTPISQPDFNLVLSEHVEIGGIQGVVFTKKSDPYGGKILYFIKDGKQFLINTSWTMDHEKVWGGFEFQ